MTAMRSILCTLAVVSFASAGLAQQAVGPRPGEMVRAELPRLSATQGPFSFVVLGDTHYKPDSTATSRFVRRVAEEIRGVSAGGLLRRPDGRRRRGRPLHDPGQESRLRDRQPSRNPQPVAVGGQGSDRGLHPAGVHRPGESRHARFRPKGVRRGGPARHVARAGTARFSLLLRVLLRRLVFHPPRFTGPQRLSGPAAIPRNRPPGGPKASEARFPVRALPVVGGGPLRLLQPEIHRFGGAVAA